MVSNAVTQYQHCNVPFSNKDKAVIKNLHQSKEHSLQRILKLQKGKTGHFTKKNLGNAKHRLKAWMAVDHNTCITEENGTTVDELLDAERQEDQNRNKHIFQHTRYRKRWF